MSKTNFDNRDLYSGLIRLHAGRTVSVVKVATARPPMTARPREAACAPPSDAPMAIGTMPEIMTEEPADLGVPTRRDPNP